MRSRSARSVLSLLVIVAAACAVPLLGAQNASDLDALYRIKEEAFDRSQLMDTVSYLTDVYGPRLTGSPNLKSSADFIVTRLNSWGVAHAKLEPWGPFGPGWSNERFVALVVSPRPFPLIAYPMAWTPGTNGVVRGEAVLVRINAENDLETYRGKLRGKIALTSPIRDLRASFDALGRRFTDQELANNARPVVPARALNAPPGPQPQQQAQPPNPNFQRRLMQFYLDEGVAAVVQTGAVGSGGTVFVGDGRLQDRSAPVPTRVVMSTEHYNRIARILEKNIPVTLEMDIQNTFHTSDLNSYNVVAELPGTDKAGEIVMLGGHLDSWHTGTGATDNAAGCAVMLEVMRILKATGLPLRRTVRLGLWTGEEHGILGSNAYVAEHFGDRRTMALKPDHGKLSVYFNLDNGTGLIRGVYLQGNEAVAPIFKQWMEPFRSYGMNTVAIRNTGGTDHTAFDAVGLPGFQFIQDPIEYDTRTHHSNMDVYDRLQASDLVQNAVMIASFVYEAANRPDKLPRKLLPKPTPRGGRGGGN